MCLQYKSIDNTAEKGEIARNEQFLFSHSVFVHSENSLPFSSNLKLLSANSLSLEESKICCLGKGYVIIPALLYVFMYREAKLNF